MSTAAPSPSVTHWEPQEHGLSPPSRTRCAVVGSGTDSRPCALVSGRGLPPSGSRSSSVSRASGGGRHLDRSTVLDAELPHIDVGRLDAKRRENRADLTSVIGAVVQRLRQANARRGPIRRPIRPLPNEDLVWVV